MRSRETAFWAWAETLELLRSAERLQRRFVALDRHSTAHCWEPAIDVYVQDQEVRLVVALPGVSAQQVEVMVDKAVLVVFGKRPLPPVLRRAAIHRLEIPYGPFERRISLPPGNFRVRSQFYEDGCLNVVLHAY